MTPKARKKTDNVSTLHVIHHGIMPLFAWQACRFVPGGHESFGALFNCFIHVVMYTYYGLAAMGPAVQVERPFAQHEMKTKWDLILISF